MVDRYVWVVWVRVVAMAMILLLSAGGIELKILRVQVTSGVPLLLMASGYLNIDRYISHTIHATYPADPWSYLTRRAVRVFVPVVVWAAVYSIAAAVAAGPVELSVRGAAEVVTGFGKALVRTGSAGNHMWVVAPLCACYAVTPFVGPWVRSTSKFVHNAVVVLWVARSVMSLGLQQMVFLREGLQHKPPAILDTVPSLGYFGFYFAGYFFGRYNLFPESLASGAQRKLLLGLFAVTLAILVLVRCSQYLYFGIILDALNHMFPNLESLPGTVLLTVVNRLEYFSSPIQLAFTIVLFLFIKEACRFAGPVPSLVARLDDYGYGIFLCHALVKSVLPLHHLRQTAAAVISMQVWPFRIAFIVLRTAVVTLCSAVVVALLRTVAPRWVFG